MKMVALQSGSNGNCIYVEADGVRLLFDAGISGKQAEDRLASRGRNIREVDALLISHEHRDHSRCMGTYQRKYGIPIHVTDKTLAATQERQNLGKIKDIRHYRSGTSLQFDSVTVETIPTPHDGVDGVAFVVDDGRHRLGILTDLGHVFDGLNAVMASLDAVLVESNYDPLMLEASPYPEFLKERIRGDGGHLSNIEAAELLRDSAGPGLRWACLGHLSAENNEPHLALRTHRDMLDSRIPIHVASRHEATDVMEL